MLTSMTQKKLTFRQMADILEKEFKELEVGNPVYSVNDLISQYGISHSTAKRTILELQKRGLIYSKVGSGSFIAPHHRISTILIVSELAVSLAQNDMISIPFLGNSLLRCNEKYTDYTVSAIDFSEMDKIIDTIEMRYPNLKGVIFIRSADRISYLTEQLNNKGITSAFWGSTTHLNIIKKINYLVYDEKEMVYSVMDHFTQNGRKQIGMVFSMEAPVQLERIKYYRAYLKENGIKYRRAFSVGTNIDELLEESFDARWFFMNMDAVLCVDDETAFEVINRATELGFKIPEELAVCGINNSKFCSYSRPKISSVAINLAEDAKRMTDLMINSIENGTSFQEITTCKLKIRESSQRNSRHTQF